jgi:hypothetical protein
MRACEADEKDEWWEGPTLRIQNSHHWPVQAAKFRVRHEPVITTTEMKSHTREIYGQA